MCGICESHINDAVRRSFDVKKVSSSRSKKQTVIQCENELDEDALRKDTVISQLNTVIENLEQIRHNQYMLYQQVKAIQENTATIASELQQIKGYTVQIAQLTALNAYYAALNERNTRITMYYHL